MNMFEDRFDAGKKLAILLKESSLEDVVIIALPRGGVVVGYEVASILKRSLHVLIVRKIGSPSSPEYGLGALTEDNELFLDEKAIQRLGHTRDTIEKVVSHEQSELKRRLKLYRKNKSLPQLAHKTVVIVDDGIATGVTAIAAVRYVTKQKPHKIIVATPVCSQDAYDSLEKMNTEVVSLLIPRPFYPVSSYYKHFEATTDEQVLRLLKKAGSL